MSDANYRERYARAIAPSTMCDHLPTAVSAHGATIVGDDGREYVDFASQVGIANVGYCHPLIAEAIAKTAERLSCMLANDEHYCISITVAGEQWEISPARLAELLIEITPGVGEKRVVFEVSGATAVNAAMKLLHLARPDRKKFFCFDNSFHGRHGYAMELTRSQSVHRDWYPRVALDVLAIPFPVIGKPMDPESVFGCLRIVNALVGEIIVAEGGGIQPASRIGMKDLVGHLQLHGVAFACDEVQTGIGRTGYWFAAQAYDLDPDVLIVGKALGGGLPLAAIVFKEELLDGLPGRTLPQSWHSGTMPAAPLAVAGAIATIEIIRREKLLDRCRDVIQGTLALELHKLLYKYRNVVTAIRGLGAMWGMKIRNAEFRDRILVEAKEEGVLLIGAGNPENNPSIRIMPPLVISEDELRRGLQALDEAVDSVSRKCARDS
jgi:4-aminobutyrate aminotransferase